MSFIQRLSAAIALGMSLTSFTLPAQEFLPLAIPLSAKRHKVITTLREDGSVERVDESTVVFYRSLTGSTLLQSRAPDGSLAFGNLSDLSTRTLYAIDYRRKTFMAVDNLSRESSVTSSGNSVKGVASPVPVHAGTTRIVNGYQCRCGEVRSTPPRLTGVSCYSPDLGLMIRSEVNDFPDGKKRKFSTRMLEEYLDIEVSPQLDDALFQLPTGFTQVPTVHPVPIL